MNAELQAITKLLESVNYTLVFKAPILSPEAKALAISLLNKKRAATQSNIFVFERMAATNADLVIEDKSSQIGEIYEQIYTNKDEILNDLQNVVDNCDKLIEFYKEEQC